MNARAVTPSAILTRIASALAVVIAVLLPATYYAVNQRNLNLQLQAGADNLAVIVNGIVRDNPAGWKFLSHFDDLLRRNTRDEAVASRVEDTKGVAIATSGPAMPPPVSSRSAIIYDSGNPVGTAIMERSLRPLAWESALAAVFGVLRGGATFLAVRVLPVRALDRMLAELESARNDAEHKAAALDESRRELEVRVLERTNELQKTNEALAAARAAAESRAHLLEQHNREMTVVSQMLEMLQLSRSFEEAEQVVDTAAAQLFSGRQGALYLFNESRTALEARARWGGAIEPVVFSPDECWAVRRGQPHVFRAATGVPRCNHVAEARESTLCLPLTAQGEMLGIVHLESGKSGAERNDRHHETVTMFTDRLGLAISNLKLRESLRSLSIRDPLTGLFNRRYMEETLETEVTRARRGKSAVAVIMLDADHFKRVNDVYGHEAGDMVLREIGAFLKSAIRGGDIACRYGGEEFCLILPNSGREAARERAESIRRGVTRLEVVVRGSALGQITFSLGVAVFPDHAATGGSLLAAADAALYHAKRGGRDRVSVFDEPATA